MRSKIRLLRIRALRCSGVRRRFNGGRGIVNVIYLLDGCVSVFWHCFYLTIKLSFDQLPKQVRDLNVAIHTAHFQPLVQRWIDVDGQSFRFDG